MFFYEGKLNQGEQIQFNINDSGWLYGANIFTTLRVYHDSLTHPLTKWQLHCDRLLNNIKEFDWKQPHWERITQGAELLSKEYPVLRITIFEDGRELITARNLPSELERKQKEGITAQVITNHNLQRSIAHHKTGNYLAPYLARQSAQKLGYEEAILIDSEGNWLETATGNLWGYSQGIWFTPQLNGNLLPGIARNFICQQAQFPIEENIWNPNFIQGLEAIAYSNSVVEIIPFNLIQWENKQLKFNPHHPAFQSFQAIYQKNES